MESDNFWPRPSRDFPAVREEWVRLIVDYVPFERIDVDRNWILVNLSVFTKENPNFHICNLLGYISIDDPEDVPFYMTNAEIAILASKIEPCMEAAYIKVVRDWVMKNGIRFNAKEGDAVEIRDPVSNMEKIGNVLTVDKGMACGRIQFRNSKGDIEYRIFNAEDILKIYTKGVPTDNNPRGGKVGITYSENIIAQAVAA